jgi:hypothetical protein
LTQDQVEAYEKQQQQRRPRNERHPTGNPAA